MDAYIPSFDDLVSLFKNNVYNVISWRNEIQSRNNGYSTVENPRWDSIIESRDPLRSDANVIYLTTRGYAGTGSHITIRKDTWDTHKLIHITIYVYLYTMDPNYPNNYIVNECSKYYTVSLNNNQITINPIKTEIGMFDPNTLKQNPPFVRSNKMPCDYMNELDTLQNGIIYDWQIGTETYKVRAVSEQLITSFLNLITNYKNEKLHKLQELKNKILKNMQDNKGNTQAVIKREREYQKEQSYEDKKIKKDNEIFMGGYLKYKEKYMNMKKLNK